VSARIAGGKRESRRGKQQNRQDFRADHTGKYSPHGPYANPLRQPFGALQIRRDRLCFQHRKRLVPAH
jgi:hypothetical protein